MIGSRTRQTPVPPGAEHELALLLCQTTDARSRLGSVIVELAATVDYEKFASALYSNGLLANCGSRLKEICGDMLPSSFVEAVDVAKGRLRLHSVLYEAITTDLLGALESEGLRALPLKGVLLARRIHGETPLRPSVDIDVLVSRSDMEAARRVIESRGYADGGEIAYVDGLPNLHYSFYAPGGHLPPVELHWRIHWYETRFSEQMLKRSYVDGSGLRRAQLSDELGALLLFYQRDNFSGLRLAADIAAWWDVYGGELPAGSLAPLLSEHPELHDALLASTGVVERLVAVPATRVLPGSPRRRRRASWAVRIADWTLRDANPRLQEPDPKLVANMALIDLLMTPKGGQRAYARRYIFQPPLIFARDHGLPVDPRLRDHARRLAHGLVRIAKAAADLCSALWEIRGGRYLVPIPRSVARDTVPDCPSERKNGSQPDVLEACDRFQEPQELAISDTARS
jgi:Uncharacterised nucleotidyltransferase